MSAAVRRLVGAGLFLTVGLCGAGAAADRPATSGEDLSWVERRVQDWQPTAEERRFDEIGWVQGIREAGRLAREHNRPVCLFTHDGRMAIGRC